MKENKIYTPRQYVAEAQKKLGDLPSFVRAGDIMYYPPNTNVFINDTDIDSFQLLYGLLPQALPNVPLTGMPRRDIVIWDQEYLNERTASILAGVPGIENRVLTPISGCGETTATGIARQLKDRYKISIPIIPQDKSANQQRIVVDDVLKTGRTIKKELGPEIIDNPNTIYAVWAMSGLSDSDLLYPIYNPLLSLIEDGQTIYAGVVYAGAGLQSSGLGLPVNSMSTLYANNAKAKEVVESLDTRYLEGALRQTLQLNPLL